MDWPSFSQIVIHHEWKCRSVKDSRQLQFYFLTIYLTRVTMFLWQMLVCSRMPNAMSDGDGGSSLMLLLHIKNSLKKGEKSQSAPLQGKLPLSYTWVRELELRNSWWNARLMNDWWNKQDLKHCKKWYTSLRQILAHTPTSMQKTQ